MAALSDATLAAISRLSVGTPVTDASDFTALTPAQVAAKYDLASYGGDGTLYALGSDGDYVALDHDDPPVTDLGLWAVGGFVNVCPNGVMAGAVAGSPGTKPTGWWSIGGYQQSLDTTTLNGLPAIKITNNGTGQDYPWSAQNIALTAAQVFSYSAVAKSEVATSTLATYYYADGNNDYGGDISAAGLYKLENQTRGVDGNAAFGFVRGIGDALTIAGQQVVIGAAVCPPVLALSSAATTTHLAAITQREVAVWKPFVVVIRARKQAPATGIYNSLYSLSRDGDNYFEIYAGPSGHVTIKMEVGGVISIQSLGPVTGSDFKVALNVTASYTRAVMTVGETQTSFTLAAARFGGVATLESIGCAYNGGQQWSELIQECTLIHPAVWTDAQLEAA